MKKAIPVLALFISFSSFATEIRINKGEELSVIVEGCKTSEYAVLSESSPMRSNTKFTAVCYPKICKYYSPMWFGTKITLFPDNKVLTITKSKAETRERLEQYIHDGICAKKEGIALSM